jgi:hypothetical protein
MAVMSPPNPHLQRSLDALGPNPMLSPNFKCQYIPEFWRYPHELRCLFEYEYIVSLLATGNCGGEPAVSSANDDDFHDELDSDYSR